METKRPLKCKAVRKFLLLAFCSVGGLVAAAASTAQSSGVGDDDTKEIVVTALRRDGFVQTTPVSVSAVSGDSLAKANIQDLTDLKSVPGLTFVDGGSAGVRLVVRGIQTVGEPTVGLYYDEMPVTGAVGASSDAGGSMPELKLFDVKHIEVLRGPQGTLYGAGAMGGSVKVIFNKPTNRFGAALDASVSDTAHGGGSGTLQAMLNVPLVEDLLAARVVLFTSDTAGYTDNIVLKRKGLDKEHSKGGRLTVRLTPTPSFTVDATALYQDDHGDRPMWRLEAGPYNATNQVRLPTDQVLSAYNVTAQWVLNGVVATGAVTVDTRKLFSASGDPSYYFQSNLNNAAICARLRGSGSSCSADQQAAFNAYVLPFVHSVVAAAQKNSTTTAELRLSSSGAEGFTWTVGGYYSKREGRNDNQQFATDPDSGDILVPHLIQTERVIDDQLQQSAFFGEGSYELFPGLRLTLGTRYFSYKRTVGGATVVPLDLINAVKSNYAVVQSKESRWISKANLAYTLAPKILIYTEVSEGYRPGGVNQVLGLPPVLQPYEADSLRNYEFGAKTRSFGNRLIVNLAAYHSDWKDMQVLGQTTLGPFQFISNAGAAEVDGVEFESAWKVSAGFTVRANAGYSNARLSADQINLNIFANGRKGDRIPYVPRVTASVEAEYEWKASQGLEGYARVAMTSIGERFSEFRPTSTYYRRLKGYETVSTRIGVRAPDVGWGAYLYAENLFDRVGLTNATASAVSTGHTLVTSISPRTVGVNLKRVF